MKQVISLIAVGFLLAACKSGGGPVHYSAKAVNSSGQVLSSKTNITTNKEGVDLAVDTLCKANRSARQVIVETRSGKPIEGSPFRCR
ncbi:hypothetical protein LVJ82_11220 [Vitreoscilla massiliensis]|uniref:Lipoprotein n=1 Tax=Vitreoscilla massiliensis TaxID=1689272 RepID=A0ABY4DX12_9NEIS|nr:hypothetical protein [Vitreoscilla massiliensis]UOO88059.1 hypothetical protein LVJ82_11220 [Vitreoscilla massiliensis]